MTHTLTRRAAAMVATGVAIGVALFTVAAFGPTRSGSQPNAAAIADGGVSLGGEPRLPRGASPDEVAVTVTTPARAETHIRPIKPGLIMLFICPPSPAFCSPGCTSVSLCSTLSKKIP